MINDSEIARVLSADGERWMYYLRGQAGWTELTRHGPLMGQAPARSHYAVKWSSPIPVPDGVSTCRGCGTPNQVCEQAEKPCCEWCPRAMREEPDEPTMDPIERFVDDIGEVIAQGAAGAMRGISSWASYVAKSLERTDD